MAYNAFKDYISRRHANFTGSDATYNAEPMISGFFMASIKIPGAISANLENEIPSNFVDKIDGDLILSANVRSVSVPNISEIQQTEKPGIGGTGLNVPTIQTIPKQVEVTFDEYFGAIVTRVISTWVFSIRDPITGLSRIPKITQSSYKGTMDLIYFDPSGNEIELAIRFYGIWPSNVPTSNLTADITTSEVIQPSVTFQYDVAYMSKDIDNDLKSVLQDKMKSYLGE